jgi:hypothetical protein
VRCQSMGGYVGVVRLQRLARVPSVCMCGSRERGRVGPILVVLMRWDLGVSAQEETCRENSGNSSGPPSRDDDSGRTPQQDKRRRGGGPTWVKLCSCTTM